MPLIVLLFIFVLCGARDAASAAIRDEPFLQETGRQILSPAPLTSVAALGAQVFAGTTNGLFKLDPSASHFVTVSKVLAPVHRLKTVGTNVWALTAEGPYVFNGMDWRQIAREPVADVCEHNGQIILASGSQLFRYDFATASAKPLSTNPAPFAIARVLSHNETLYIHAPGRLTYFEGGQYSGRDMYDGPVDQAWDFGDLQSPITRDVIGAGQRLYIATDRGLALLRGMSLTTIRGADELPFEDTTCLANGFGDDVWIGTTRGAIRHTGSEFHYFSGQRWLPSEKVNAIAVGYALDSSRRAGDSAALPCAYIATDAGLAIIEYHPFNLEAKAAFYEEHLKAWGQKRLGFVHKLEWDEPLHEFVREASDNDGGFSGDYLAAQCFRYAVTHDPIARAEAVNTFKSLNWLRTITGIPGFPARAVWVPGEIGHKSSGGSGGYPAEWHPTADGKFEWKGDTSSDEICSHFYATAIFLELAAQGDEIQQAREHIASIATHLIDHKWQLIDLDGKPTRWGRWDPDYFLTEEGRFDRGLQCLEILSFIKTAEHFALNDADRTKFHAAYNDLIKLDYHRHTLRQRNTFPPDSIVNFEDQLSMWAYYNLLKYETNPNLRSLYRRSLERTWEILRIEQQPWFNYTYAALTGNTNEAELDRAAAHLREWPLDLRIWSYQNSHRADLFTPSGYKSYKAGIRAFSPREREPLRWDNWTMQPDGGNGGHDVVEPSGWLMAYWLARYYNFLTAPEHTEAVEKIATIPFGVKPPQPYNGPARPN